MGIIAPKRTKVFKVTRDDWYPSYFLEDHRKVMLVEVTYHGKLATFNNSPPVWRTSVWGNDDCGMEIDCATEQEAWDKFVQVISMDYVDRVSLKAIGFISA